MKNQRKPWYTALALILIIALVMPILAACDDDDDDETTIPAATTPAATTAEPKGTEPETPMVIVSDEPVKMGVVIDLTGSMAMAGVMAKKVTDVVEKMVEDQGGIQVGDVKRPVEFIFYDDNGKISGTQNGWSKLVNQDHISIMAMGGATGAQVEEMAAQAAKYKIPHVDYSGLPADLTDYPYTVHSTAGDVNAITPQVAFIRDLNPRTVAFLAEQERADHEYFDMLKSMVLDPIGAEVVVEQYIPLGTIDMSPYITKVKLENPDLFIQYVATFESYGATYKQIYELGGWGDMKYLAGTSGAAYFARDPGAVGTYMWMQWAPNVDNPGTIAMKEAFEKYGVPVTSSYLNFWNAAWTAVHAVELAGSDDPEEINRALRSGKLQWEAPTGLLTIGTDGNNDITGVVIRVDEGNVLTIVN